MVKASSQDPQTRRLLALAAPLIVMNFAWAAMQLTDTWLIGFLGSRPLTYVAAPNIIVFALASFGYGFFSTITALVSREEGDAVLGESVDVGRQAIKAALVLGGLALACLAVLSPPLISLFSVEAAGQDRATSYLRISGIAIAIEFVVIALSSYFIGIHRTWIPTIASTA